MGRWMENFVLFVDIIILVMMFRCQIRVNTAMPANSATPLFLTSCETEMHVWKYG